MTASAREKENSLEARVAKLEMRVDQMQKEIHGLSGGIPAQVLEAIDSVGKKHPGPLKKIDDTELLLNRDSLVQWLEEHWPQIATGILTARNPQRIAAVLETVAKPREIRSDWQSAIIDHPHELREFLDSEKFRRKPPRKTVVDALAPYRSEKRQRAANRLPTRQIANAMAGIPKIKWRTSFDKCSHAPSSHRVGHNAEAYYRASYFVSPIT